MHLLDQHSTQSPWINKFIPFPVTQFQIWVSLYISLLLNFFSEIFFLCTIAYIDFFLYIPIATPKFRCWLSYVKSERVFPSHFCALSFFNLLHPSSYQHMKLSSFLMEAQTLHRLPFVKRTKIQILQWENSLPRVSPPFQTFPSNH